MLAHALPDALDENVRGGATGVNVAYVKCKQVITDRWPVARHVQHTSVADNPLHSDLAVSAAYSSPLIADGQLPAPFQTPTTKYFTTIFGCHTRPKAVFAAARNALWLPCSLRHCIYSSGVVHLYLKTNAIILITMD
jgi:hypothetical protein